MKQLCSKIFVSTFVLLCAVQTSEGANKSKSKTKGSRPLQQHTEGSNTANKEVIKKFLTKQTGRTANPDQIPAMIAAVNASGTNAEIIAVGKKLKTILEQNPHFKVELSSSFKTFYKKYKALNSAESKSMPSTQAKVAPAPLEPSKQSLKFTEAQENKQEEQAEEDDAPQKSAIKVKDNWDDESDEE